MSGLYFCKQCDEDICRRAPEHHDYEGLYFKLFQALFFGFLAKNNGRAGGFKSYLLLHKPHIKWLLGCTQILNVTDLQGLFILSVKTSFAWESEIQFQESTVVQPVCTR